MSIEGSLVISAVSLAASLLAAFGSWKRGHKADNKQDATEMAMVIVKLEGIERGIDEIKSDSRGVKAEVKELRDRLITAEQQVVLNGKLRSAWEMLAELKGKGRVD